MGILTAEGRVLIGRRPAGVRLGGLWEFPGGKLEPGESPDACVRRELAEEVGLAVRIDRPLSPVLQRDSDLTLELRPFLCRPVDRHAVPRGRGVEELRWVMPAELRDYRFPAANAPLLDEVAALAL